MIRCKQSKNRKIPYGLFTLRAAGLVLLLALWAGAVCGCAGEDKYVEIIIAADDGVATPVLVPKESISGGESMAGMPQGPAPTVQPSEEEGQPREKSRPGETEKPAPTPAITPTPIPTITPIPTPIFSPTPAVTLKPTEVPQPTETPRSTAAPKPAVTPVPTATPKPSATAEPAITPEPTPTPAPTPDTEKLMQKELDDVYAEYVEEWEKLYAEYETKCALVQQSLNFMGEPSDDPEYIEAKAALEAELDTYAAEFKAKEEALEAVYYGLYSAVYDKYGK